MIVLITIQYLFILNTAGLNSIENAVRNSKDKVRKTLYTMTESKGTRGASRVAQLRPGKSRQPGAARKAAQLGSNIGAIRIDVFPICSLAYIFCAHYCMFSECILLQQNQKQWTI